MVEIVLYPQSNFFLPESLFSLSGKKVKVFRYKPEVVLGVPGG
jgi:hypothetical protein